jgi:hypothetical protein
LNKTPVVCQQLKRTGARSAGRSVDSNDFILTACIRNMMWVGPGRYNLDVGREMAALGLVARMWEEDKRVLSSDYLTRKADLFVTYSSSFGPGTSAWREARN